MKKHYWYTSENAKNNNTDEDSHSDAKHRVESFNNDIYIKARIMKLKF